MANKVEIQITGDNKSAKTSIANTEKDLTRLGRTADTVTGKVGAGFNRMGNFFKQNAAAIGIGTAAVTTALGYMMKKAIDAADNMSKASQRIGIATEELSTLSYVADLSGVSFQSLETGLARFNRNIYDSSRGLGEANTAFKTLGITTIDSNGKLKSANQSLLEIATRFQGMQDGAQKTALSLQLFGRAGTQLIPLLNQGADGIGKLQEEARKLGLEISTNTGKQAEQFNDNLERLKSAARGASLRLATELLPSLNSITDMMVKFSTNSEGAAIAAQHLGTAFKSLITLFGGAIVGATTTAMAIGTLGATLATFISSGSFERAGQVFSKGWKDITDYSLFVGDMFNTLWTTSNEIIPKTTQNVDELGDTFIDVSGKIRTVHDEIKFLNAVLKNTFGDYGSAMVDPLTKPILQRAYDSEMQPGEDALRSSVKRQIALITQVTEFDLAMAMLREQSVSDMFGNMANAALGFYDASGQASKSAFGIYKAMAIAQTAIATYQAAVEAYKSMVGIPVVGPGLAVAAAAAATAFGLGNIARISSMSPGGGAGAGSVSPGSVPRIPSNVTNNTTNNSPIVNVNIYGFVDKDLVARDLLPSIRRAIGDGA